MSMPKLLTYKHYDLLDNYPVGSIYMSLNSTNPENLFGGIWEQIKDTFLLATGDKYLENTEGGADSHAHSTQEHALTIAEMPSHDGHIHPTARPNKSAVTNGNPETSYYAHHTTVSGGSNYGWVVNHSNEAYPATLLTGGNIAHTHGDTSSVSNLPPYMTVYVWKRIQ